MPRKLTQWCVNRNWVVLQFRVPFRGLGSRLGAVFLGVPYHFADLKREPFFRELPN